MNLSENSAESAGIAEKDGKNGAQAHQERIIHEAHDGNAGGHSGKPGSHQQLRAVRNQPLHQARESVENTCSLPRIQAVLFRDILRYPPCRDDGYGVVRRTEIRHAHQGRYAEFGSALS